MDPHQRFCHNRDCWAYGRAGEGHVVIHSQKECRYQCKRCSKTAAPSLWSGVSMRESLYCPALRKGMRYETHHRVGYGSVTNFVWGMA